MYQESLNDTIAAIATPYGQGGIGIVRLSGKIALEISDKIFKGLGQGKPSNFKSYSIHYGKIIDLKNGIEQDVDEVLLSVMRAPKSYTCEDIVEIHCHGGIVPVKKILTLALDMGARLAMPGEFTKRAFLNGRIDLTQAEAVLDVIQSKTETFLKASVSQLKGDLAKELGIIREDLMKIYAQIEGIVNFPEDDTELLNKENLFLDIKRSSENVQKLLSSSDQGVILRDGIKVVICGKANVGKSSLLNVFLKRPRAIVSHIEGTTRDSIEEAAQIQGIPLRLVDTAGFLEPRDDIEREATRRSRDHVEEADIVLFLVDASQDLTQEDCNLLKNFHKKKMIVVFNKIDCSVKIQEKDIHALLPGVRCVLTSALYRQGIDNLEKEIIGHVLNGKQLQVPKILVSNIRQIDSLKRCFNALLKAQEYFSQKLSLEFVSEEIKIAVRALDQITGKDADQDLIEQIFSLFCIGK